MNNHIKRFFLLLSICVLFLAGGCDQPKDGTYSLDIYVTSDIHGSYLGRYYLDDSVKPNSLSKVSTLLNQERSGNDGVILIDNGDNLQGDNAAFYFNFVDTASLHIFAKAANYLKYDAIVVGNHDIEAGHSVYDRVRYQYDAPLLAANALHSDGPDKGKCYFQEYTIVNKNGLKVAIIGFTNPAVTNWVTEPLYRGIEFKPVTEMAQATVDMVKSKHRPDFVIVSMHCGAGEEDDDSRENPALYLAKRREGVDLVISGHDHRARTGTFADKAFPTAFVNPGARCHNLGHVHFDLTFKDGRRVGTEIAPENIPLAAVAPDAEYDAALQAEYTNVKQFTLREICQVSRTFDLSDALRGPSEYMQLLYDVQLAYTGADITFAAPLSSTGIINKGVMVYNDLTRIYPFENKLFTIVMTGKQIKDYLEYSFDRWINREGPSYCYDSAGGLRYKVYRNRPAGSRVEIESMADGTGFEAEKPYKVAITSYRAMGGDGLLKGGAGMDTSNPDAYIIDKQGDIRELLYGYLTNMETLEPKVCDNWKFIE